MLADGVELTHIYEMPASGCCDDGPNLAACFTTIQPGNTFVLEKPEPRGRDREPGLWFS